MVAKSVVQGNYGKIVVATDTGFPLSREPSEGGDGYADVIRVDIERYKRISPDVDLGRIDIVDIGYWYVKADGHTVGYEPPDGPRECYLMEMYAAKREGRRVEDFGSYLERVWSEG